MMGDERAFTLNEILISIAFTSIGILGFSAITLSVMRANFISNNYSVATNLAQDKMEELKARRAFADVANCSDPPDRNVTALGFAGGIFNRCWIVRNSPLGKRLKEITVSVRWLDYHRREVILSTLVFTG